MRLSVVISFLLMVPTGVAWAGCNPCICGSGGGEPPPPECPPSQYIYSARSPSTTDSATPTGIPLDREWKRHLYAFAQANVVHPSWGLAHSERNYQVTISIAGAEHIAMDLDVLFAAAYLHDIGGLRAFIKKGVDHAVRSVEVAEPLLREWGFPMEKFPQVKDMILGHTYYGPIPTSDQAVAFRDADIVDFLGSLGVARILAITQDPEQASTTLSPPVRILRSLRADLPGKLTLGASVQLAEPRLVEMDAFLRSLDSQSFNGKAL